MKKSSVLLMACGLSLIALNSCKDASEDIKNDNTATKEVFLEGKEEYLDSPFVTAGDRVYMVGHQDGSFPELGWHITGEMGGVWNHPIKLLDGFGLSIETGRDIIMLQKADKFTNYPWGNSHDYGSIANTDLQVNRTQFAPDGKQGIVVWYTFTNTSAEDKSFGLNLHLYSDLMPTWLGERTDMKDGQDQASMNKDGHIYFSDSEMEYHCIVSTNLTAEMRDAENNNNFTTMESPYNGNGLAATQSFRMNIPAGESRDFQFVISGSYESRAISYSENKDIRDNWPALLEAKKARMAALANQSKLTIPDKKIEEAFEWLKYNSDWVIRDVPHVGRGITAGIPDYPWWFGVDSEYALKGYMTIGQTEIVESTIALLDSVSEAVNGNGRIIHEMSTNGAVFNPGNINETPQFASLIWEVFKWNGDKAFLERYFPTVEKGLAWLMDSQDVDGNLFPDGFGMMEIHGMDSEMIDVAAYTQRAFADAAAMAEVLGKAELAQQYQATADQMAVKINEEFWSEEFNSFADFIGTDQQALHLIEDAIVRADTLDKPWAVEELKATRAQIKANPSATPRPFVLHHNWVVNTPMEMKIADPEKAMKALDTGANYANPFGMFVTGIDRDESAGSDDGSFKGPEIFSYTGAVMTLPTAVQIVGENNYGRPDKALNYLQKMTRSFSYALPGSMYEVSPDYGMIVQAWNIYGYGVPLVQQFFGIQPMAHKKTVYIRPQMPSEWNIASLENVKVADNIISIYFDETENGQKQIRVNQTADDWEIVLELPMVQELTYSFNEGVANEAEGDIEAFSTRGKNLELNINKR
ncbi:glycogen debranching protein [Gilvibacter sediminis]|uniref:alpha-L-rhamnosidase-related protein n=1 Tax=Gilvibacter sediminis TaxID=379071 RepID=UPI0023500CBB|nr:glycogen debranching protein [Gilvibacter sediminis]MDC7998141.1 glycogen debranching protein [Gilvibacter sediminis]